MFSIFICLTVFFRDFKMYELLLFFFQFAVILLALFIGKVAIGTFAFIQVSRADEDDGLKTLVGKHVSELVRTYGTQNTSRDTMDLLQNEVIMFFLCIINNRHTNVENLK